MVGYRVTNVVSAKIREVDGVGAIIDAVAQAGGDLTRVDGVSFSVDDPSDYYEEAREEAMADAKGKAERLARLAGVKLGKATFISEGTQLPVIRERVVGYAEAVPTPVAETPISPGETEVTLLVQVAYSILD